MAYIANEPQESHMAMRADAVRLEVRHGAVASEVTLPVAEVEA